MNACYYLIPLLHLETQAPTQGRVTLTVGRSFQFNEDNQDNSPQPLPKTNLPSDSRVHQMNNEHYPSQGIS